MQGRQSGFDARNEGVAQLRDRAWVVQTPNSTYIVALADHGQPVQRYWGARIPEDALAGFAQEETTRWTSEFQRPSELEEELPFDGGFHWAVPGLQLRFENEVRALDLHFESAMLDQTQTVLRIRQVDREFDIDVVLEYRTHLGSDVIARRVEVLNRSHATVTVLRADSGNWSIPDQHDYRISTITGYWGAETQLERLRLPFGEHVLTSRQGLTGHGANPWLAIDDGTATEEHGEVRSFALAWSGSWRMTAQRRREGQVSVIGGFGHDGLQWSLAPGESLRSPWMLGQWTSGGFGEASRSWHRHIRRHVLPHGDELRPVLYNSWEATWFDIDEPTQIELADIAADIGIELFVMDDGWFGDRANDRAGLGDWFPRQERFPRGLGPLIEHVRSRGMAFGIWVEPEMVSPDSHLYRTHPDWVLHWPNRRRNERRSQLVLNFSRADVREWALRWLDDLASTADLDFLKWDMNRPFTEAGWPSVTGQDRVWIDHVRGVYEVIDRLRAVHPGLRIEACASGGGRIDLGILERTDQVWTSDNTDALDRQLIQHGFSQLYPAGVMAVWVADRINPLTERHVPLEYRFDVAMAGVLGIGADIRTWTDAERYLARDRIALYKKIRSTVQHGRLYRLGGAPGQEFSAIEYVDDDRIVLLQYEPRRSLSSTPRRVRLQGLDPDARYADESERVHHASVLLGYGVPVLPRHVRQGSQVRFSGPDYASEISVYTRIPPSHREDQFPS